MKKLRITVEGKTYEVEVEVLGDDTANPAPGAAPATRSVSVGDAAVLNRPPSAASTPVAPGAVRSPLTGRVVEIAAAEGQAVKEGDTLVTIEAMKMNTFVYAPRAGKVTGVSVSVGEAVEEGQGLVTIE